MCFLLWGERSSRNIAVISVSPAVCHVAALQPWIRLMYTAVVGYICTLQGTIKLEVCSVSQYGRGREVNDSIESV